MLGSPSLRVSLLKRNLLCVRTHVKRSSTAAAVGTPGKTVCHLLREADLGAAEFQRSSSKIELGGGQEEEQGGEPPLPAPQLRETGLS